MAEVNTQAGGAKLTAKEGWNLILMIIALGIGGFTIIYFTKESVKDDIKDGAEAVKEIITAPVTIVKDKYSDIIDKQEQTYNDKYSSSYAAQYKNAGATNQTLITLGDKITFGKASEYGKRTGDYLRSKGWW